MWTLLYPHLMLSLVNHFFLTSLEINSLMSGSRYSVAGAQADVFEKSVIENQIK